MIQRFGNVIVSYVKRSISIWDSCDGSELYTVVPVRVAKFLILKIQFVLVILLNFHSAQRIVIRRGQKQGHSRIRCFLDQD